MMELFSRIARGCYPRNIVLTIENMYTQLLESKDLGLGVLSSEKILRCFIRQIITKLSSDFK